MVFPSQRAAQRVVTQNLLLSASCALIDPEQTFVKDLATIINLTCLYDDLLLPQPRNISVESKLIAYLQQTEKLLRPTTLTSDAWAEIIKKADQHLSLASKGLDTSGSETAFTLASEENSRGATLNPDSLRDGYLAKEALKTVTANELGRRLDGNEQERRIAGYALRTFLYLGVADHLMLPLTSDAARTEILDLISRREQDYIRQQIIDLLGASATNDLSLSPTVRAVSAPLAAIVFSRAKSRADIVPQIATLRAELKDLRVRIRPWEEKRAGTKGKARDKATNKLNGALDELGAKYHLRRQAFSTADFVQLGPSLAGVAAMPQNPAVWLPLAAKAGGGILKWQERRFFVELHHEYDNVPSASRQAEDLRRLFNI